MKKYLLFLSMVLAANLNTALAAPSKNEKTPTQKICEALAYKIEVDCAHLVCDEEIENGSFKDLRECTSSSDYAEFAQVACEDQPTLEDLVNAYNKKHPKSKITCD